LLASAGHDLRQPIVSLRAAMQVLIEKGQANNQSYTQFKQAFSYIETLINQYLSIPENLREHSDHDSPPQSQHDSAYMQDEEIFPIEVILKNIASMFEHEAQIKGLNLVFVNCSASVRANPIVVMRVLCNLVENAIKYTQSGKVLLGCRRRENCLSIQVHDTGPGISKDKQHAIFEAYSRAVANDSNESGLGLGLSIATKLARESGLGFELVRNTSNGCTFSLSIPLA